MCPLNQKCIERRKTDLSTLVNCMKLIILAGMPATGKTTIAAIFRNHFGFPVLEKDAIKECLFDTIGFESYAEKSELDVAANTVLLKGLEAMLESGTSVIVDNNFDEQSAQQLNELLEKYSVETVTIFMTGNPQTLYERYVKRDSAHARHLGHAMQTHYPPHPGEQTEFHMTREGFDERFIKKKMDVMLWTGKQINVDATHPERIDVDGLIKQIEEM